MSHYVHNWGRPGIDIPTPGWLDGYGPNPTPLPYDRLKLAPTGLFDLRRNIGILSGQPGVFEEYLGRFLASDIAWFVDGASTDNKHHPSVPGFFPEFKNFAALNARIQNLTFDLATVWDRLFGGTTMILHIEGTTVPNTLPLPHHGAIAQIAQLFIEAIGVPTVQQWRTNAHLRGWRLTQPGPTPTPNAATSILVPQPLAAGSAHYKFRGRPVGALDQLLKSTPAPAPAPVTPAPVIVIPDDDDDEVDPDLLDVMERAGYAEFEARHYRQRDLNDTLQDSGSEYKHSLQLPLATRSMPRLRLLLVVQAPRHVLHPLPTPDLHHIRRRAVPRRHAYISDTSLSGISFPRSTVARAARVHVDMETFISENRLDRNAIVGMVRYLHPARWYNELTEELQLTDELATELNEILAAENAA
ncbi:hypothetical protein C8R43DRAFT_1137261 [Mycena crocata]|nr:hypothetical protein C8R43DRAFT_1137261 [Mycena crocata]